MKTLDLDVRFLAAGNVDVGANPLQYFVSAMSLKQGRITAKLVLKVLAAKGLDSNAGTDLRLFLSPRTQLCCLSRYTSSAAKQSLHGAGMQPHLQESQLANAAYECSVWKVKVRNSAG
jgi:hypothetical protein